MNNPGDGQEQLYKSFIDNATEACFLFDSELNYIYINKIALKLIGLTRKSVIGKNIADVVPDIKQSGRYDRYINVINTGAPATFPNIVPHPKFGPKNIEIKAFKVGKGMGLIINDITHRIKLENDLLSSKELLLKAEGIAGFGNYSWDIKSDELHWSEGTYRVFDVSKTRFRPNFDGFIKFIHPEDKDHVLKRLKQSLEEKKPYHMNFRIVLANGQVRYLHDEGEVYTSPQNEVTGMFGVVQDISDRIKFEQKLVDNKKKYQDLVEMANIAILSDDYDGNIKFFNKKFMDLFGYSRAEIKKLTIGDLVHPDDQQTVISHHRGRYDNPETKTRYEFRGLKKDRTEIFLEVDTVAHIENDRVVGSKSYLWDISERKELENELNRLYQLIPDMVCIASVEGYFLKLNPAWEKTLGFSSEELLAKPFVEFIHPDDVEITRQEMERLIGGKGSLNFVNRYRCKDGSYKWLEWQASPTVDRSLLYATARDITERIKASRLLEENENKLRLILEGTRDLVSIIDKKANTIWTNKAWNNLFGKPVSPAKSPLHSVHQKDRESVAAAWEKMISRGKTIKDLEYRFISPSGDWMYFSSSAYPINIEGNIHFVVIAHDITGPKKFERELLFSELKLRKLTSRLIDAQENERRRISQELHDEVGQALTGLKINLSSVNQDLKDNFSIKSRERIVDSISHVDQLIDQIQQISLDLRPALLDDLGLIPTLRWYVSNYSNRTGIPVTLNHDELKKRLSRDIEINLFRIVQEALNNIIKHSEASEASINIEETKREISIIISDNGIGFDEAEVQSRSPDHHGTGLTGIRERVSIIGGTVEIISEPASGTRIEITILGACDQ